MCGIFGFWRTRGFDPADYDRLRAMGDSLVHRGPDDSGYLQLASETGFHVLDGKKSDSQQNCNLYLGNRRLAIVDPSSNAHQPMHDPISSVFLVYNGEIYNHNELRSQLKALGYSFKSKSDTEVLLNAYLEWGEDCVNKLNGMWAFVIWDQRCKSLIFSRDRFGIKPLYFAQQDDIVYFSSESRAIRGVLASPPAINRHAMANFILTSNLQLDSNGFFEAIDNVRPATITRVTADKVSIHNYWKYSDQSQQYDFTNSDNQFIELLSDSVNRSFQADREVGILLSGGLDSTTIASLQKERFSGCQHAFTSVMAGHDDLNEFSYARLMASQCNFQLHVSDYRAENLVDDLYAVSSAFDAPVPAGQVMSRYHLLQLASQYVPVVVEGQGADEMLGGYFSSCFRAYARDELDNLNLRDLLQIVRRLLQAFTTANQGKSVLFPLGAIYWRKDRALRDGFYRAPQFRVLSDELRDLSENPGSKNQPERMFSGHLNQQLYLQHKSSVLPRLLTYGDQISMAHSVESRVPFLDHRLVEFLFALPYRDKINGKSSKMILRRSMRDRIPECILHNTVKIGFDTPTKSWLIKNAAEVQSILARQSARERGLFDHRYLQKLIKNLPQLDSKMSNLLFRCLALEVWSEQQSS